MDRASWKPERHRLEAAPDFTASRTLGKLNPPQHAWCAATSRLLAIASAVPRPGLKVFLLPFGAPGDNPPCMRHRPFGIAGDRHRLPLLVRALHRGLRCIGNLFQHLDDPPTPRDPRPRRPRNAHQRLPAGMDVDMLRSDLLLALAAVTVEGL
jgi:hypothetical protein